MIVSTLRTARIRMDKLCCVFSQTFLLPFLIDAAFLPAHGYAEENQYSAANVKHVRYAENVAMRPPNMGPAIEPIC